MVSFIHGVACIQLVDHLLLASDNGSRGDINWILYDGFFDRLFDWLLDWLFNRLFDWGIRSGHVASRVPVAGGHSFATASSRDGVGLEVGVSDGILEDVALCRSRVEGEGHVLSSISLDH